MRSLVLGSGLNDFWQYLQFAGLGVWLAGAIYFLIDWRVFSPKPLEGAPARQSTLSLPVAGAVIVLYFMIQAACVLAAVGLGVPQSVFTPQTSAAAETAPAAQSAFASADHIVVINCVLMTAAILTAIPVLVVLPRLFAGRSAGWGLHPRQVPAGVLKGLLGFFVVFPILVFFALGLTYCYKRFFGHDMSEHSTFEALDQHIPLLRQVLLCANAVVVAPITEELLFRGVLQSTLIQYRWGFLIPQVLRTGAKRGDYRPSAFQRWGAIVLVSVLFAYQHPADQAPIIFVLSLALGYVYERTGNLWAPIALHMAFNSTEIVTYFTGA